MLRNRMFTTLIGLGLAVSAVFTVRTAMASSRLAAAKAAMAEAVAIYHQSEWASVGALPVLSAEGLAIYHNSERTSPTVLTAEGLAIYYNSERDTFAGLTAQGLAIYKASEHASRAAHLTAAGLAIYQASERASTAPAGASLAAALAAYHQSEWGRTPGGQFNAYQRSEWFGADR